MSAASPGRQYHIGLAPGELAERILLVGDPARAARVAEHFDQVELERSEREYRTFTGSYRGQRVSVMATGMGCDNTDIAVQELLRLVERPVLLRVGSSGALQPGIALGEVVVSTGAVRLENTSLAYVEPGFPALAHPDLVLAARTAAARVGAPHRVGLTATAAGFYGSQERTDAPIPPRETGLLDQLASQGVLNLEMESSTLFTLAALCGARAGAVCAVYANRPEGRFVAAEDKLGFEARAIAVGLATLELLAEMDAAAPDGAFNLDRWREAGS